MQPLRRPAITITRAWQARSARDARRRRDRPLRADVLVQPEDVVRVPGTLELDEARELLGSVRRSDGGIVAGSSIGGLTLDTSLGETGPATLGVVMVALGLIPLAALAMKRASRTDDNHRFPSCAAHPARA